MLCVAAALQCRAMPQQNEFSVEKMCYPRISKMPNIKRKKKKKPKHFGYSAGYLECDENDDDDDTEMNLCVCCGCNARSVSEREREPESSVQCTNYKDKPGKRNQKARQTVLQQQQKL